MNSNEIFKKDLFDKINLIKAKLARDEKLNDEDMTYLLMSSVLEEEG